MPMPSGTGTTVPTIYLVDLEHPVIVDVEATAPNRQAEASAAMDIAYCTRERLGL